MLLWGRASRSWGPNLLQARAEATRTVALAWEASVLCSSFRFLITLLPVSVPHDDIRSPQPAVWFGT